MATAPQPVSSARNDEPLAWGNLLAIGVLLLAQTFFTIDWPGPWEPTFTTGALGLLGIALIYLAWFRRTFSRKGIIPTTDLWSNPSSSIPATGICGIVFIFLGWLFGGPLSAHFPAPAGMVLFLIGMLTILVAVYAALVLQGPLKDLVDEEE
tara:strand:+ start:289 stop:744 length:456 start_codon:yes stop_codon:yes gene_type:complete